MRNAICSRAEAITGSNMTHVMVYTSQAQKEGWDAEFNELELLA